MEEYYKSKPPVNSILSNSLPPKERLTLESKYITSNINAFKFIRHRNYQQALELYAECFKISQKLKDQYKINDSLCNYSIVLFYNGKINDSISTLEQVYASYQEQRRRQIADINNASPDLRVTQLNVKVICNLIIAYLATNNIKEAENKLESLIEIINFQNNYSNALSIIKNIIFIFFRVESLVNLKFENDENYYKTKINLSESDLDSNNNNNGVQEKHKEVINKIINCFHLFLNNNNIDLWIQCLNDEIENLKLLKDYNGLIFAIFNVNSCIYFKSYNSLNNNDDSLNDNKTSKNKLMALIKALTGENEIDERKFDQVLLGIREKLSFFEILYKKIYNLEQETLKSYQNEIQNENKNKNNNNFIIKFLLKYCQSYINNNISDDTLKSNLTQQITITLNLLKENEYSNNISLEKISPEIYYSFSLLFENLSNITIRSYFKQFLNKLRYRYNANKILMFIVNKYKDLCIGEMINKVNLSSNGTKNLHYSFDESQQAIVVKKNKSSSKIEKDFNLESISKFRFGIFSQNLFEKKAKNKLDEDRNWLYFSIYMRERDVDLVCNYEFIKVVFYGLYFILNKVNKKYKICSASKYVINRIKMKMIYKLNNRYQSNCIDKNYTGDLRFDKLKNYLDKGENDCGYYISFAKVMKAYNDLNVI